MSLHELRKMTERQVTEIDELKRTVSRLQERIDDSDVTLLKRIISSQASRLERMDSVSRSSNAIVFGIQEDDDKTPIREKATGLVKQLNANINTASLVCFRLGKPSSGKIRPVKIIFASAEDKKKAVDRARQVFRDKNIYFNYDEPELTRKENQRLHTKLKQL